MKRNLDELWQAVYGENNRIKPVKQGNIKRRVSKAINSSTDKGLMTLIHINKLFVPVSVLMVMALLFGTIYLGSKVLNYQENEEENAQVSNRVTTAKKLSDNSAEKESVCISLCEDSAADEDGFNEIRATVLNDGFFCESAKKGDEILAVYAGTVTGAGWETGYGYCVSVTDKKNRIWKYAHCDEILVGVGEVIHTGDLIARAGDSGVTTGTVIYIKLIDVK